MTRTQVLQEIRRMRFKEAYGGWQERRLTQEEAARLLGGVSVHSGATWTATRTRGSMGWWTSAWARSRHGEPRSTRWCAPRHCTAHLSTPAQGVE